VHNTIASETSVVKLQSHSTIPSLKSFSKNHELQVIRSLNELLEAQDLQECSV